MRQLLFSDPGSGIRNRQLDNVPHVPECHLNLALQRELKGVREKVQHDLFVHVSVDIDRLGQGRCVDDKPHSSLFDARAEDTGEFGGEFRQFDRLVARLDAPGLDPREVQQRVDELLQAQGVAV